MLRELPRPSFRKARSAVLVFSGKPLALDVGGLKYSLMGELDRLVCENTCDRIGRVARSSSSGIQHASQEGWLWSQPHLFLKQSAPTPSVQITYMYTSLCFAWGSKPSYKQNWKGGSIGMRQTAAWGYSTSQMPQGCHDRKGQLWFKKKTVVVKREFGVAVKYDVTFEARLK